MSVLALPMTIFTRWEMTTINLARWTRKGKQAIAVDWKYIKIRSCPRVACQAGLKFLFFCCKLFRNLKRLTDYFAGSESMPCVSPKWKSGHRPAVLQAQQRRGPSGIAAETANAMTGAIRLIQKHACTQIDMTHSHASCDTRTCQHIYTHANANKLIIKLIHISTRTLSYAFTDTFIYLPSL